MAQTISRDSLVLRVTFSCDTSAYASADLIADTQEIGEVAVQGGRTARLECIHIIDQDDQKNAMTFVFLNASTSMGTENSAPNISDANILTNFLGQVTVAATDYIDVGTSSVGSKISGLEIKPPSANAYKIYVAIVNGAGTPTYTASGLVCDFVFSR